MSIMMHSSPTDPYLGQDSQSRSPYTPILPFATQSDIEPLYELGPELGRGQFGIIRSCTSPSTSAHFACKSISKLQLRTDREVDNVVREVTIMKELSNGSTNEISPKGCLPAGIIRLYDVIEDCANVHLIMELCHGGELYERIANNCYSEKQAACVMRNLLETLQFCHSKGILHRDIKPENILLVDNTEDSPIKLADFGLALQFSPGQKFSQIAGSTYYMAPEMLQGEYSEEVDIWSTGVTLYVLLSGMPPFWGPTEHGIMRAIRKGPLTFPKDPWCRISASAKDLTSRMLCRDVKSRLTPAQALKHPWILKHTTKARQYQMASRYKCQDTITKHIEITATSLTSLAISSEP